MLRLKQNMLNIGFKLLFLHRVTEQTYIFINKVQLFCFLYAAQQSASDDEHEEIPDKVIHKAMAKCK